MDVKVRIIGSKDCPKCDLTKRNFEKDGLEYEWYDADLDDNQEQLDGWRITNLPVIQLYNENNILLQFPPGPFTPKTVRGRIIAIEEKS